MENSISSISVNSKGESMHKDKTYCGSSTKNDSKCLPLDSGVSNPSQNLSVPTNSLVVKGMTKKIQEIENSQKQLIAKFKKVQDNLEKQIEKKDQINAQLQRQVSELRAELEESKKDLSIITEYLKKKALNSSSKTNRKPLFNSSKGSGKLDLTKNSSKETHLVNSTEKKVNGKSRSPRAGMFKRF